MKTTYYNHIIEVLQSEDHDKRFAILIDGLFVSTPPAYTAEDAIRRAKAYLKAHGKTRK